MGEASYGVRLQDGFSGPAGAVVSALRGIQGGAAGSAGTLQQFANGLRVTDGAVARAAGSMRQFGQSTANMAKTVSSYAASVREQVSKIWQKDPRAEAWVSHQQALFGRAQAQWEKFYAKRAGLSTEGGGGGLSSLLSGLGGGGGLSGIVAAAGPIALVVGLVTKLTHGLLGAAKAALQLAFNLASDFGKGVMDSFKFVDQMRFSLTRFLGDAGKAKDALAGVMKTANELGLDFQKAAGDFKNLISAGFDVGQSNDLLRLKADLLAMGGGAAGVTEKVEAAFGHIAKSMAKGRMEADSFYEILGNLPVTKMQILEKLAPKLGKSISEIEKMDITKLPIDKLVESIKEATLKATGAGKLGETAQKAQLETAAGAWEALKKRAGNFVDEIALKIGGSKKLAGFINKISEWFDSAGAKKLVDGLATGFERMMEAFSGPEAGKVIESIGKAIIQLVPHIPAIVSGIVSFAVGVAALIPKLLQLAPIITTPFRGLMAVIKPIVAGLERIAALIDKITGGDTSKSVVGLQAPPPGPVQAMTQGLGAEAGGGIVSGMASSINRGASSVIGAVTSLATRAVQAAKRLLGISSPSKVFAKIGLQTAEGMEGGLTAGGGGVQSAMRAVAAPPGFKGGGAGNRTVNQMGSTSLTVPISVQGADDPQATAEAVERRLTAKLAGVFDALRLQYAIG